MKELKKLLYLMLAATLVVGCSDDDDDNGGTPAPTPTGTITTIDANGDIVVRDANTRVPLQVRRSVVGTLQGVGTSNAAETITWRDTVNRAAEVVNGINVPATNGVQLVRILRGLVFVNAGDELVISPGSVIQAQAGQGASATSLIVQAGARINANGTADRPIIFTYEGDDVTNNTEARDRTPGQWGGVVIIGNAPTNLGTPKVVEGIASSETRATYGGGTNADDNSGTFRYVSIRNTGTFIAANSELQGLTLAGVGRGTTVEYVESIFSNDDGIEVFGGTVNLRYVVVAFCDDDAFDFDQGWQGFGQFFLGYLTDAYGNRGFEWDGDDETENPSNVTANGQPYTSGVIANVTMIGNKTGGENQGMEFRNNSAMSLFNSIVADFSPAFRMSGVVAGQANRPSTWDHFVADRANFRSNVWAFMGATPADNDVNQIAASGTDAAANVAQLRTDMGTDNNIIRAANPFAYPATNRDVFPVTTRLNPIPSATTGFPTAATLPASTPANFFTTANYIGAFATGTTLPNSWAGWTYLARTYGVQ